MFKAAIIVAGITISSIVYGADCRTIKSLTLTQATGNRTIVTAGFGDDETQSFNYGTYNVAESLAVTTYVQTLLAAIQSKAKVCISGSPSDGSLNVFIQR